MLDTKVNGIRIHPHPHPVSQYSDKYLKFQFPLKKRSTMTCNSNRVEEETAGGEISKNNCGKPNQEGQ